MSQVERAAILDKDLILDTGVLKTIFHRKNPAKETAFWNSVGRNNFYQCVNPFFVSTFMMALEFLGFKASEIDPFKQEPSLRARLSTLFRSAENVENAISEALQDLIHWYNGAEIFTRDVLRERFRDQLSYRSDNARHLCTTLFSSNIDRDYSESLKRMAFASLLGFDYERIGLEEAVIRRLDCYFLDSFRYMIHKNYEGYSFARPSDRMVRAAYAAKRANLQSIYEAEGEGLDTEIVNFAAMGHFREGKYRPAAVFTCEKISRWRDRVERYFVLLSYLLEHDEWELYPGTIYQVDQATGELKEQFNIYREYRDHLPAFKFAQDRFLR